MKYYIIFLEPQITDYGIQLISGNNNVDITWNKVSFSYY